MSACPLAWVRVTERCHTCGRGWEDRDRAVGEAGARATVGLGRQRPVRLTRVGEGWKGGVGEAATVPISEVGSGLGWRWGSKPPRDSLMEEGVVSWSSGTGWGASGPRRAAALVICYACPHVCLCARSHHLLQGHVSLEGLRNPLVVQWSGLVLSLPEGPSSIPGTEILRAFAVQREEK